MTGVLEAECSAAGVRIFLNTKIREIGRVDSFEVSTEAAEFHAPVLVVATGGLSIPKIGATAFGYDVARQFGLKIVKPWPALVPLVFGAKDKERYCDLAGVSAEVVASTNGQSFREKMLITHRGLSGPAILQISSYWEKGRRIQIDLAPGRDVFTRLAESEARGMTAGERRFKGFCPSVLLLGGSNCTRPERGAGAIKRWRKLRRRFMNGRFCLWIRKDMRRPR